MLLRFIYVVKHEELEHRVRNDLPYIERMSGFFKWWLNKNFGLHYETLTDVLAVEYSLFRRIRFGLSDLIEHHRKKDKDAYHVYLAYFKPLISDCSIGYFADNFGLIQWTDYASTNVYNSDIKGDNTTNANSSTDDDDKRIRFFAIENCTKVSHIILHEVGRRRGIASRYNELIHEEWNKHISKVKEFEYYDSKYKRVDKDRCVFATMSIPAY
jgi:hypothetical protein